MQSEFPFPFLTPETQGMFFCTSYCIFSDYLENLIIPRDNNQLKINIFLSFVWDSHANYRDLGIVGTGDSMSHNLASIVQFRSQKLQRKLQIACSKGGRFADLI